MTSKLGIVQSNLSFAWAETVIQLVGQPGGSAAPWTVKVEGFNAGMPPEDIDVRALADADLAARGMRPVHTVANTLFPHSFWDPAKPRQELYDRFKAAWPRIKRSNPYGHYFQRLMNFEVGSAHPMNNQLEFVLTTYARGNHRGSALQAVVFDPRRDHTHQPRRGFPCLQQVTLQLRGASGLGITGVYAVQYAIERAYGNYLGLARLGYFMAQEMGRTLEAVTCVANRIELNVSKASVRELVTAVETRLAQGTGGAIIRLSA
jgi:hypothetical protein